MEAARTFKNRTQNIFWNEDFEFIQMQSASSRLRESKFQAARSERQRGVCVFAPFERSCSKTILRAAIDHLIHTPGLLLFYRKSWPLQAPCLGISWTLNCVRFQSLCQTLPDCAPQSFPAHQSYLPNLQVEKKFKTALRVKLSGQQRRSQARRWGFQTVGLRLTVVLSIPIFKASETYLKEQHIPANMRSGRECFSVNVQKHIKTFKQNPPEDLQKTARNLSKSAPL